MRLVNDFTKAGILVGASGEGRPRRGAVPGNWRWVYSTMAKKLRAFPFERAAKALQENVTRAGPAAAASYTLVGGIILLGGIGYAADAWRGTSPWFLLGGLTAGIVVGFYELVKSTRQQ